MVEKNKNFFGLYNVWNSIIQSNSIDNLQRNEETHGTFHIDYI